jgi:glycosyltransferase involved in cell wall biosynthesis
MFKNGIVIPIYNEKTRLKIDKLQVAINLLPQDFILQIVDDGSTDGFGLELLESFRGFGNVSITRYETNLGKANALLYGFKQIIRSNPEIEFLGFMDADFSAPMSELLKLFDVAMVENLDFVCGVRISNDRNVIKTSRFRRTIGQIFTLCSSLVLGIELQDSQCGCKVFKNTASFREMLDVPPVNKWLFDLQAILLTNNNVHTRSDLLKEVPLEEWVHMKGSKIRLLDVFDVLFGLLKLRKIITSGFTN